MSFLESFILSITMAADAMCAGASDGIKEHDIKIPKCLIIALCFGIAQFLMPLIGYFVGYAISDIILPYIPWIAFAVMLLLGLKSLFDGTKDLIISRREKKNGEKNEENAEVGSKKVKPFEVFMQSIATSIDALSVGFSLVGSLPVISDAMIVFTMIGVITFALSFLTTVFGKFIGKYIERFAPFVSGLIFIGLAIKFLIEALA